jgi:hypothetical protein
VPRSRLRVCFTSVLSDLSLLQLVLPPNLLGSCLQRVVALSRAYHDEECEDLSEVTWSEVAGRIGLNLEVVVCR